MRDALSKLHGGDVTPEQPPKGEHASNGAVEEAGRTVRVTVRVYKLHLEDQVNKALEVNSPIVQWMARWAAMALSRFRTGQDSQTAYERQRGRRCNIDTVPFGEKVWFRQLSATDGRKRSLQSKWKEGIWLGHCWESNEV